MSTNEQKKEYLIETVERELADFAQMVKTTNDETIIFHQHAFATDLQEEEFRLLGMAIKYAGLHNREIMIVPEKKPGL